MANEPNTLQEAIIYFAEPTNCLTYLATRRWLDGVICPKCGCGDVTFVTARRGWQVQDSPPQEPIRVKVADSGEENRSFRTEENKLVAKRRR